MYECVDDVWPDSLINQGLKSAFIVTSILHDTPAHHAGIRPGWRLIQLNNHAEIIAQAIDDARVHGITQMVFLLPGEHGEVRIVIGDLWPNGMIVVPTVSDRLKRDIAANRIDSMLLDTMWGEGAWRQFALLKDSFLTALQPVHKRFLPGKLAGNRLETALRSDDYLALIYLSLCYLAEGDFATAGRVWDRAVSSYETDQRPHPASFYALMDFIKAEIDYNTGHVESAKALISRAVDEAPDICLISQKYAEICREKPVMRWSPWMQKRFPVHYDFPCSDPLGVMDRPGARSSLRDALDQMRAGQVHIVFLMGPYRRNRPFFRELVGLASLYRRAPDRIASAHVIVGQPDSDKLWEGFDMYEQAVLDTGLDFRMGSDAGDRLIEEMGVANCPSVFVLDKAGTVLSVDFLDWELGFFNAINRMSDPVFQAEVREIAERCSAPLS